MSVGIKASLAYPRPPEQHTPADVDGPSILLAELRIPLARRLRRHHVTEAPNLDPVLPAQVANLAPRQNLVPSSRHKILYARHLCSQRSTRAPPLQQPLNHAPEQVAVAAFPAFLSSKQSDHQQRPTRPTHALLQAQPRIGPLEFRTSGRQSVSSGHPMGAWWVAQGRGTQEKAPAS